VAVRALPHIPGPELHIAGVGERAYVESLKSLIRDLGVEDRVKLLGFLPKQEVLGRMREASIVLSASLIEEYFGRVNIEAMACGTPLLASDTENLREIGKEGEHLLVYRQSAPLDMAARANRILQEPGLAERLVESAYQHVQATFSQERIGEQIENYLLGVVAGAEESQRS
jgi:D-inositol-3-phosphate glycosyltransferase